MDYKLMFIPNDDTQNCPFCRLQILVGFFEPANQALIIITKVFKPIDIVFFKTLGTGL